MTHSPLTVEFVLAVMFVLVAMSTTFDRHHKCISCGRRFEHAKDCPVVRDRD